nr:sugar transferase [Clostridia bacterium]
MDEQQLVVEKIDECVSKSKIKAYDILKRFIDIIIGTIGLIVCIPIFIIIGIAIKIDSKGPVFFKHKRIGKHGKKLEIYKFRTMIENAEEAMKNFTEEQKKEFAENFKLENDPRVTRVGKILRKTSLDELPQIINILKGEMSIIGPRPVVRSELEKYGSNQDKFLSVAPGLTGNWAANGRSDVSYEERMALELDYIENRNLILDMKIFFKTIGSVLKGRGAR